MSLFNESLRKLFLQGCLVKTGKYTSGDESKFSTQPDFTEDSFASFVEKILSSK